MLPSVPQQHPEPAPALVPAGCQGGEEGQGFGAVETWVEEAEEYIVQEEGDPAAHKCYHSMDMKT